MSFLVRSPDRHSIGNSQRGSALAADPTDSVTQKLLSAPRRTGARASLLPVLRKSSGADRVVMYCRTNPIASAFTSNAPSSFATRSASFSAGVPVNIGSANRRSASRRFTSSAPGAAPQAAVIPAQPSRRSAFLRSLCGTISADTPLRPARPVRPDRCNSVSLFCGRSACTTSSRLGRSMPRAATSVATQTRARPSRMACREWVRSACDNSPESATTEKPRLARRAVR